MVGRQSAVHSICELGRVGFASGVFDSEHEEAHGGQNTVGFESCPDDADFGVLQPGPRRRHFRRCCDGTIIPRSRSAIQTVHLHSVRCRPRWAPGRDDAGPLSDSCLQPLHENRLRSSDRVLPPPQDGPPASTGGGPLPYTWGRLHAVSTGLRAISPAVGVAAVARRISDPPPERPRRRAGRLRRHALRIGAGCQGRCGLGQGIG